VDSVLTVLLAGGKGSRLDPLTRDRAKPAVPFAGMYRIVDFALSNCINSRLFNILALTQYKSLSLEHHIAQAGDGATTGPDDQEADADATRPG
jgi:glucose-1-phosphate adenylyltransferase